MSARLSKYKSRSYARTRRVSRSRRSRKSVSSKKIAKIVVSTLVFIFSLLILGGYFFYSKLNTKLVGAESTSALLNDHGYSSILYVTLSEPPYEANDNDTPILVDSLRFLVLDKVNNKIVTHVLPKGYVFDLEEKYGQVDLEKLFSIGLLHGEQTSADAIDFINTEIFKLFAFPVDNYVYVAKNYSDKWDELFNKGNYLPIFAGLALNQDSSSDITDLNLNQIYQNADFIASLPDSRLFEADITKTTFALIDDNFREITLDSDFAREGKSVAVLNAGDLSGLAGFGARVVKNIGGRVVDIDNSPKLFGENFIICDDTEGLTTLVIKRIFNIDKILTKQQAVEYVNSTELYRADILVVLAK